MTPVRLAISGAALADWIDNTHYGQSVAVLAARRGKTRGAIYARILRVSDHADLASWAAILDAVRRERRSVRDVTAEMVLRALDLPSDPLELTAQIIGLVEAKKEGARIGCSPAGNLCAAAKRGDVIARAPLNVALAAVAFDWLRPTAITPALDHLDIGPRGGFLAGEPPRETVKPPYASNLVRRGSISAEQAEVMATLSIIASTDPAFRDRLTAALPPHGGAVLAGIALDGSGIEDLERSLRIPARSGKFLLSDALDMVDRLGLAKLGAVG